MQEVFISKNSLFYLNESSPSDEHQYLGPLSNYDYYDMHSKHHNVDSEGRGVYRNRDVLSSSDSPVTLVYNYY